MKPKGVTTQMKALNEYILIAVFTSNSWTVKWNLKCVTQMKALNEYILIAVFTSNSWTVKWNLKVWPLKWKLSMSTF